MRSANGGNSSFLGQLAYGGGGGGSYQNVNSPNPYSAGNDGGSGGGADGGQFGAVVWDLSGGAATKGLLTLSGSTHGNVGGTSAQYAKVTGTHEIEDGVIDKGTTLQLVPDSGNYVDIKYAPVSYSDNLYLYNPYQTYTTSWTQPESLAGVIVNSVVNLTLNATMTISNSSSAPTPLASTALNETPFPTVMSFDSGTLPTGLTYTPSTGVLAGTVTTAGTYTFTIAATNGYWNAKRQFSLTVGSGGGASALFHFDNGSLTNSCGGSDISASGAVDTEWKVGKFDDAIQSDGPAPRFYVNTSDMTATTTNSLNWDGEFTVDFWVEFNDNQVNQMIIGTYAGGSDPQYTNNRFDLAYLGDGDAVGFSDEDWLLILGPGTGSIFVTMSNHSFVDDGQWYHIAVTRDSNNKIRFFQDGTGLDMVENGVTYTSANGFPHSNTINPNDNDTTNGVGYEILGGAVMGGMMPVDGKIDELRIVKGSAEWTSDFTPPTDAWDC